MLRAKRKSRKAPCLDTTIFDPIISDGNVEKRRQLARQLAELVAARATPPAERQEVTGPLLKLLMDPVKEIRAAIARILTPVAGLHPDLVFAIAADEEDIALPFLSLSPSVQNARQMAIFEAGDVTRRKALAGRCDLDGKLISAMALKGQKPVILTLLDNPSVNLKDDDLKRIYVRFRHVPEVTDRLLSREALPLEIRIAHVRATSERMREKLRDRRWAPPGDVEGMVARAEEMALMEILARAKIPAALMSAIAFMSRKNALTPSVILRAGCHGHVAVLEHALAYLAGMRPERVHAMAHGRNPLSLRALHARSGLPRDCRPLVRAIFETGREMNCVKLGQSVPPEKFGRALLEKLARDYNHIPMAEKTRLVEILSRFCDDKTRALAERFNTGLLQAA